MTISTQAAQITINGNGVTTVFGYNFIIPFQADGATPAVEVTLLLTGGQQQVLSPSDYSITGVGSPSGGTVTYPMVGSPLVTGAAIQIARALEYTQPNQFVNQGFLPHAVENSDDDLEMQIQQLAEGLYGDGVSGRFVRVPVGENGITIPTIANRGGKLLAFDSNGLPVAVGYGPAGLFAAQDLSNVVPSSVMNAMRRAAIFVNPIEFGAIGDGVHNDTAAFQAAIATGITLLLTPGTYLVNQGSLVLSTAGQGIFALNRAATIIKLASVPIGTAMVTLNNVDQYLQDLTLDGGGFVSGSTVVTVLVNATSDRYRVQRVIAQNFAEMGVYTSGGASDGKILDNTVNGTQIYGLKITVAGVTVGSGGTNGTNLSATISGGTILGGRVAKVLYDVVAGAVTNVRFTDYGRYNVLGALPTISFPNVANASALLRFAADLNSAISVGITGAMQTNIQVSGNKFVNGGIHFRGLRCKVYNNEVTGATYGAAIADAAEAGCGLNEFFDNHIHDCGRITGTGTLSPLSTDGAAAGAGLPCNGYEIYGSSDVIDRNRVETVPGVGIFMSSNGGKIIDNEVSSNGAYWHSLGAGFFAQAAGIVVSWLDATYNGTNVTVRGNRSSDSGLGVQHYGFATGNASIGGLVLEDNNCQNNVTGPYYNAVGVVPARFKGARIVGHVAWDPPAITTGTDTTVDVTVSGYDLATRWIPIPFFDKVSTEWVQLSASWLSPNVARIRMYSMSGTYNFTAGTASVAIDELFPIS